MKNTTLSCGFDALIIAGEEKTHDSSIVDGVVLDVFVYPAETFSADYDPEEFVQVWDCLLYTSPSPRDDWLSRMPSSA